MLVIVLANEFSEIGSELAAPRLDLSEKFLPFLLVLPNLECELAMADAEAMIGQRRCKLLLFNQLLENHGKEALLSPIVLAKHAIVSGHKRARFATLEQCRSRVRLSGSNIGHAVLSESDKIFAEDCHAKAPCCPRFVLNLLRHPEMAEAEPATVQKLLTYHGKHHAFV